MPLLETIGSTNFDLPGQIEEPRHGKVADTYTLEHKIGRLLVAIRTDRISAYDVVLPQEIPFKGQSLNQLSSYFLDDSKQVAANWHIASPDPNVTIGRHAEPIKVEMIIRGYLLGNSWKAYEEEGLREIGGVALGNSMSEFDPFDSPLLTPTTKAEEGHDIPISTIDIIDNGLASSREYAAMAKASRQLFSYGQNKALERGLLMADTKYEFGRLPNGEVILIDEVHTPDSSRYFYLTEYAKYLYGERESRPQQLSKEFIREWLRDNGFSGRPGQVVPNLPDDIVAEVSQKYISLYEQMRGRKFEPVFTKSINERLNWMKESIIWNLSRLART